MSNFISAISSLAMAAIVTSCNVSNSDSTVRTNFSITGAGENTVAETKLQKVFSVIIPSAQALTPPASMVDAEGKNVSLSNALIAVKKVQFRSFEEGSDSFKTIHYEGPFFIDLLSESPKPFGDIELPTHGVRRVKMLLHKSHDLPSDPTYSVLDNKSIFISGIVGGTAEGTGGIMFTFSDDDTTDFNIKDPTGVVPEEGKDLVAVIRLADLFKKINFSALSGSTDISAENRVEATDPCPGIHPSAKDLYTCFVKGISLEAKLSLN